jgi:hypothetical protein
MSKHWFSVVAIDVLLLVVAGSETNNRFSLVHLTCIPS